MKKFLRNLTSTALVLLIISTTIGFQSMRNNLVPEAYASIKGSLGPQTTPVVENVASNIQDGNILGSTDNGKTLTFNYSCPGIPITDLNTSLASGISLMSSNFAGDSAQVVVGVNTSYGNYNAYIEITPNSTGSKSCTLNVSGSDWLSGPYTTNFSVVSGNNPPSYIPDSFVGPHTHLDETFQLIFDDPEDHDVVNITGVGGTGIADLVSIVPNSGTPSPTLPVDVTITPTQFNVNKTIVLEFSDNGTPPRNVTQPFSYKFSDAPFTTTNNCQGFPISVGVDIPTTLDQLSASNITGPTLTISGIEFTHNDADHPGDSVTRNLPSLPAGVTVTGGTILGGMTMGNTYTADLEIDKNLFSTGSWVESFAGPDGNSNSLCQIGSSGGKRRIPVEINLGWVRELLHKYIPLDDENPFHGSAENIEEPSLIITHVDGQPVGNACREVLFVNGKPFKELGPSKTGHGSAPDDGNVPGGEGDTKSGWGAGWVLPGTEIDTGDIDFGSDGQSASAAGDIGIKLDGALF